MSSPSTGQVIKVTWRAGALQEDAEICRGEMTGIMKTKFLFKASLNLVPLFYPGTAALSDGRRLSLEILKLPREKKISPEKSTSIYPPTRHEAAPGAG